MSGDGVRDGKARILIIDDELAIRNLLRLSLTNQGFEIADADRGQLGLDKATEFHPHLIILDLGLPDMGGLEVLKGLRKWTTIPVIILTVNDDETTKVALLDAGADDYLTKPFGTPELLARVRVALRRHGQEATPVFKSGDLEIDLSVRQVKVGSLNVKLTATEFELLSVLVRNQGRVVPQAQLLTEVWGKFATEETHYLRIYVGQLRKKIESDSSHPKHILTDPGIGYRIV
jgi:two-component system KDP operon response regulator KdpE